MSRLGPRVTVSVFWRDENYIVKMRDCVAADCLSMRLSKKNKKEKTYVIIEKKTRRKNYSKFDGKMNHEGSLEGRITYEKCKDHHLDNWNPNCHTFKSR